MIFKHKFEFGLENINSEKKITNKALLQFLENCATKHADSIQDGVVDIIDSGITWVLIEWNLRVLDRPRYGDTLEIHTWIRNITKLYTFREFEIYVEGKLMAIASAKWLLVDINTLKPVKITDELVAKYQPELNKNAFGDEEFPKIVEQDAYEQEIDYYIRKSDIDINNHVHNLNYLDMAYEVLDIKQVNNVRILYKKEIKYNDKIKVLGLVKNSKNYIKIYNLDDNSINALIELY